MKTTFATLVALGVFAGSAFAGGSPFVNLGDTAPRSVFDDTRDTAPRSVFDDIRDTAPRTIFDDIRDTSPRSDGVFGKQELTAP